MCHLLLLMPVFGVTVFWLLPLQQALPIYGVILLISALFYWLIFRTNAKPMETGVANLIGSQAEVVSRLRPGHHAKYLVRAGGELWSARSKDMLEPGEAVDIAALNGISLVVERRNNGTNPDQPSDVEIRRGGSKTNERHYH